MPSLLIHGDTSKLEHQLEHGSVQATLLLASMAHSNHVGNCKYCEIIGYYYTRTLTVTNQVNELLYTVVQQAVELIQSHLDIVKNRHLPWYPVLINKLREIGKHIKDESTDVDAFVPLSPVIVQPKEDNGKGLIRWEDPSMVYGRAIRISIYYCRATLYEESDMNKSIHYYRKCLSVHPPTLEQARIVQQSARLALSHLIADQQKYAADDIPRLASRTSSVSSVASSSGSRSCANCGIEKKTMPVCSKCKVSYYCGVRCLKAHKPAHSLECQ
ncbi:hypothetical protein BDB01DRAFT_784361 [Pilobolus umbonatus]|nr:hypothetical protein BDB01DRAFT_784361 [Pilobolus umbonatus]